MPSRDSCALACGHERRGRGRRAPAGHTLGQLVRRRGRGPPDGRGRRPASVADRRGLPSGLDPPPRIGSKGQGSRRRNDRPRNHTHSAQPDGHPSKQCQVLSKVPARRRLHPRRGLLRAYTCSGSDRHRSHRAAHRTKRQRRHNKRRSPRAVTCAGGGAGNADRVATETLEPQRKPDDPRRNRLAPRSGATSAPSATPSSPQLEWTCRPGLPRGSRSSVVENGAIPGRPRRRSPPFPSGPAESARGAWLRDRR